jgi:hypothetical protein
MGLVTEKARANLSFRGFPGLAETPRHPSLGAERQMLRPAPPPPEGKRPASSHGRGSKNPGERGYDPEKAQAESLAPLGCVRLQTHRVAIC